MTHPHRLTYTYRDAGGAWPTVAEFPSLGALLDQVALLPSLDWASVEILPLTDDTVPLVSRTGKRVLAVGRRHGRGGRG